MSEINIEKFRSETRKWLEKNCPISMRGKTRGPSIRPIFSFDTIILIKY